MVFDALGFLSDSSFDRFREDNQDWLENYALFAAIYEQFQYLPLPLWGDEVARVPMRNWTGCASVWTGASGSMSTCSTCSMDSGDSSGGMPPRRVCASWGR